MKVASSGDVGLALVPDGAGRGLEALAISYVWQGGAFTNLSRVKRDDILQSEMRELGSFL